MDSIGMSWMLGMLRGKKGHVWCLDDGELHGVGVGLQVQQS